MKTIVKIKELWEYLKIQDNEILVIQVYNPDTGRDEYIMAVIDGTDIMIETYPSFPEREIDGRPFQMVQHLDSDGRHAIPSVGQMAGDALADY